VDMRGRGRDDGEGYRRLISVECSKAKDVVLFRRLFFDLDESLYSTDFISRM